MEKCIVYSTWFHEKGLRPAEAIRDGVRKNVNHILLQEMLFGGTRMMISLAAKHKEWSGKMGVAYT